MRNKSSEEELIKKYSSVVASQKVGLLLFFKVSNKVSYVTLSCSYYEKERIL